MSDHGRVAWSTLDDSKDSFFEKLLGVKIVAIAILHVSQQP